MPLLTSPARLAAALLLAAGLAHAGVDEEYSEQPYAVQARPDQTLEQALNAATPIIVDGQRFHGYTRWHVRWTFRWWREESGRCNITEAATRLRADVQLPELHGATPRQRALFERYRAALSRHEQGHVQFGRDAAQAIDQGIARLPAAPDCATLERDANALGQRLLREYAQRERDYDRATGHGATQGARLD